MLVLNNSRVIPARLRGVNAQTGGQFEIIVARRKCDRTIGGRCCARANARASERKSVFRDRSGNLSSNVHGHVIETNDEGHRRLRFTGTTDMLALLDELGEVPLPPYITRADRARTRSRTEERYQTVFAATQPARSRRRRPGLHFTEPLLKKIRARGVNVQFVTLHVGLGTFAPVKTETLAAHKMHEERYEVSEATARAINQGKGTLAACHRRRHDKRARAGKRGRATPRKTRRRLRSHDEFSSIHRTISKSWMRCSRIFISPAPRC